MLQQVSDGLMNPRAKCYHVYIELFLWQLIALPIILTKSFWCSVS